MLRLARTRAATSLLVQQQYQHTCFIRSTMTSQTNGSSNGGPSKKAKTNGSTAGLRTSASERVVSKDTINPAVIAAEYAVRGEIALRAEQLREECSTEQGKKKLGFNEVISCNIGNPQQLGQKPVTFFRQVSRRSRELELDLDRPPFPPLQVLIGVGVCR